jgi:fumarylacetoacetase
MTSISPWVVTVDALSPFTVPSPPRDSPVAPYLNDPAPNGTYAVELHAEVIVDGMTTRICTARLEWMYWSFRHIFAHQCIGGCGVAGGDIIATGTASGTKPDSLGCLLEMSMGGKKSFEQKGGLKRAYLEDSDSVRITGFAGVEGDGVGFGECIGKIVAGPVLKDQQNRPV